ncbi:DUF3016 domain-containing protein [Kangiella koreensis]|uniref:DUF3016 domain-containing protein n=1 Tax=Kangiella koreensis (strain DSM 16069 / JCM 12317 / KCTC 12182 / SW-125) TaxID=523791 RepID=C7R9K6_KANKD|nr:DUF3016 domain-containing protein [Kangiella koreensis]ACV26097.1 conserved hypothetical protein [Kangiella koreensis DSM 16069]
MRYLKSAVIALLISPLMAVAGEVKVSWAEFDDFIDVRPASETKSAFYKRVKTSLEKSFIELGEKLPDGTVFELRVSDLDLAGDIRYGGTREYRLVERLYYPKMKFDYQLVNAEGKILKEGSESIKDMGFLDRLRRPSQYRNEGFFYEKLMFENWFEENIEAQFK